MEYGDSLELDGVTLIYIKRHDILSVSEVKIDSVLSPINLLVLLLL